MSDILETILDFVEGRVDARQFETTMHADAAGFERALNHDLNMPIRHPHSPSVYLFLIQQDFSDPGDVLDVHDALSQYLERSGILCRPTSAYGDFYTLLLQAQPNWLSADSKYLAGLVELSGGRTGEGLRQWLHAELLNRFRYLASPPDWIQDAPIWPMGEDGPLYFLGQMNILNYFHDVAAAYIFHNQKSGRCETIIQMA